MSKCDFKPLRGTQLSLEPIKTDQHPLQTLTAHEIFIEPSAKGNWRAHCAFARRTGITPQSALAGLVKHRTWQPWPHPCQHCNNQNTVVAHSPRGDNHLHWYCPDHAPRTRRTK